MKRIFLSIVCLAMASLACLDSAVSDISSTDQTIVTTRTVLIATAASAITADRPALTDAPQLCVGVVAETAENIRAAADLSARIIARDADNKGR